MKKIISRRTFLRMTSAAAAGLLSGCANSVLTNIDGQKPPNFIIIFTDDLGYGDLACFGHPTIRTPNLDKMARQGVKLTQFYSAASVCTPSRAALLTGRLPIRSGMCSDNSPVLYPFNDGGLPAEEITLAKALKEKNYATACIGKWHLGHLTQFLPTSHGFDYFFGLPYSNDMYPLPLLENEQVIERPVRQDTLTKRYTEKALNFIRQNRNQPFFLYFAHTFPHVPLSASEKFFETSKRGLYGDVVEELDWSVGRILDHLEKFGIAENTLVLFTSDNGPWLTQRFKGGSAGLLRGGKGTTWEGGIRMPCIARWPGKIRAASICREPSGTLDILPTFLSLAGLQIPKDRIIDGQDISDLLFSRAKEEHKPFFFYHGATLWAVRKGHWKAHFITSAEEKGWGDKSQREQHNPPLLFHVEHDPSEKYDIAGQNPKVIEDIMLEVKKHNDTLQPVESQLEIGQRSRPTHN